MKEPKKYIDILKEQEAENEAKKSDEIKELEKTFREEFMKGFPKPNKEDS